MIPYQAAKNISIIAGCMGGFVYGSLLNSILLYLPLVYQAVYLETPLEAAKSTLPLCCLVVAINIIVSVLIDRIRRYRLAL